MKAVEQLKAADEFTPVYLEHLIEKARTSKRRKANFNHNDYDGKRTHWANQTGTYRNQELRKGPKYWNGQKPVRVNNLIRSYHDLAVAICLIASGDKDYSDYKGVVGINRERLRLAQSWKDKGISYEVSDIVQLSFSEIKNELGFGKAGFGKVYLHKLQPI